MAEEKPEQQSQTVDDEALDTGGRNLTLGVFGVIVLLIVGLVVFNYFKRQALIGDLKSPKVARRVRAAELLVRRASNDSHVAEQFQGEPPSVRMAAARALRELGTADAAMKLVPFMKDGDLPIRFYARDALIALGPDAAMAAAMQALGDTDANVRDRGAEAAITFGQPSIAEAHPLLTVKAARASAAQVLWTVGNAQEAWRVEVRHAVLPYLNENQYDEPTENIAIKVLDEMRDVASVPELIRELDRPQTRRAAVGALGRIADLRATQRLIEILAVDETVRAEIVVALGQIKDPRSVAALIEHGLGSVSDSVRANAADALKSVGSPAIPQLMAALRLTDAEDPIAYKRSGSAAALGGMREASAVAASVGALSSPHVSVRKAAATALGDSGDPRVITALARALGDANGEVAAAAAKSLAAFGEAAVPVLIADLRQPESSRLYWAQQAITLVGLKASPSLKQLLAGEDANGVRRAALVLANLGDGSALEALQRAETRWTADPEVEFALATAIERLGGQALTEDSESAPAAEDS